MKILIVEDDEVSSFFLNDLMDHYGECDTAADGVQALDLFKKALEQDSPYDLVCLDIMMPKMDGRDALRNMRFHEESRGIEGKDRVKIIMTTALEDMKTIVESFKNQCDAYLVKPYKVEQVRDELRKLGLIK